MREVATRARIEAFLHALAHEADSRVDVYLVGGTSAVLFGWRDSTKDIDLIFRPETDRLLRAIPALKERLNLNVELASPDQFVPVPAGWEGRSRHIATIAKVTFRHYDLYAQALAKLERGHARDIADVRAMVERGLIVPAEARAYFVKIEPELHRYPAVDPPSFRRAVEEAFPEQAPDFRR